MANKNIYQKIESISAFDSDYMVFGVDENKCYYGKNRNGEIVFMIPSNSAKINSVCQETKSLIFYYNKKCKFSVEGEPAEKTMHVLICKENNRDKVDAFIRLTYAFSVCEPENDQYYMPKLFSSISMLFDKQRQVSEIELQGLFAELYVILYFYRKGCRIDKYWQSRNKMKFDFSIDEKKRLEIKSTVKSSRTHHFKHDQLLSELYDIKVVSLMLQKNDCGISLNDLVESIRENFVDNYALLLHVEGIVSQIDDNQLAYYKYDETFIENNIRFYDAVDIPHFKEKTPDGVFNAEYDCCLDNVDGISQNIILEWLR